MSQSYHWGLLAGLIIGVIIVGVVMMYNKGAYGSATGADYDERQQLLRGKAFQKAFFSMMGFSVLYWAVVKLILQHPIMEDGLSSLICVFLGVGVFAIDCILHDAYFTVRNKPKTYIMLFTAVTICQIPAAVLNVSQGTVMENGVLTFSALPIASAVLFLSILCAVLIKQITARKEEE